jgi:glutathione synthase/RimK-type ligase-like ATP-grasp enzyme
MAALDAVGRRLDLDYAGIDFTLLPDGRLFVFEANATMLVHRERSNGVLAYRNAHVQRIVDAFERLQSLRIAG